MKLNNEMQIKATKIFKSRKTLPRPKINMFPQTPISRHFESTKSMLKKPQDESSD